MAQQPEITANSPLRRFFKGDRVLYWCIAFLMLVSVLAIYSSTSVLAYQRAGGNTAHYVISHVGKFLFGLFIMGSLSNIKPMRFSQGTELLYCAGVVMLLATFVIGKEINGSARWIALPGGLSFQPSELAKIFLVLFVSKTLANNYENPDKAFWPCIIASGIVCGLILKENLSTFLLTGGTVFCMLIIGRISWFKIVSLVAIAVFVVGGSFLMREQVGKVFSRSATWFNRVERFTGAHDDTKDYQAEQALAAVSSGGMMGRGPGNSYMKNFLPMAFSDFIFAIILEEYGIFGFCVVVCYFTIFGRARSIARRCVKPFQIYTIVGLAILICLQAIIHIFVCVGLFPVTGQTLPLVSMGGTSSITMSVAFGIMLSISSHAGPKPDGKPAKAAA